MGRYVKSGAKVGIPDQSQALVCGQIYPRFSNSYFEYSCDINECWPNRVVVNTPGSYSFTFPSGATCARAVVVGGGGKWGCRPAACCVFAGAGGAYSEKFFTATAGTTATLCVGSQQSSSTFAYPTASVTLTAGGASFCTPGTATGGDWNSTGGCAGMAWAQCCCATNFCVSAVACCGYCVVIACMPSYSDSGIYQCCATVIPGGGSAGSFIATTGGAGGNICEFANGWNASGAAGGGGGIGVIQRCIYNPAPCNCICANGLEAYSTYFPGSAQGGGGTKWHPCLWDMCKRYSFDGYCQSMWYGEGHGHPGGKDNQEGLPSFYWHTQINCCSCFFPHWHMGSGADSCRHAWHDIYDISGSGSVGKNMHMCPDAANGWNCRGGWGSFADSTGHGSANSGEGAGTGGHYFSFCDPGYIRDFPQMPFFIDWTTICCLGTTGRCCDAFRLRDKWFPQFISCAGTLGGSGGVNTCNLASKAGYGGGAGGFKRFIYCVCYGGAYDCCAQAANTPLAFPPSCLDWLVSNAGTGLAIIYWK